MNATASPNTGAPDGTTQPCGCCDGTRQVLDIVGQPRPCSRCGDRADFNNWYAAALAAEKREDRP